jgi:glycosyltransferase involved in cell wall biosynthesis
MKARSATVAHDPAPGISAIMPVYNAANFLPKSLPPLLAMVARAEIAEIIVVDDGSMDASPSIAQELGATMILSTDGRSGPSVARNLGAKQARGDILWFVDSDVVVHADAAKIVATGFSAPEVVAVFGSYDDTPPANNFFSQYKNLIHHFYHQRAKNDASTFWAGCGAVRKAAFLESGGFDGIRYRYPSIEDIELGYRLRAAGGRIRLLPALQGTHLKIWRLTSVLHTDIFRRALPWSRLLLTGDGLHDDLNVGVGERLRAVLAALWVGAILAAILGLTSWWVPSAMFLPLTLANLALAKFFFYRKGVLFFITGLLFHQVYYLYSTAAFAYSFCTVNRFKFPRE